jgi:hypothetical protein
MVLGSTSLDIIHDFLKSPVLGYMEYNSTSHEYKYDEGIHVTKGFKFDDLIGIGNKSKPIINDIDRYFNNLNKYRQMGLNKGLNYVINGPPRSGKTSFVKALAHYYHANLFIYDSNLQVDHREPYQLNKLLNPVMDGISIVLIDNFDLCGDNKGYFDDMYYDASENVIRIFVTNVINYNDEDHSLFINECSKVFDFKGPDLTTIILLISIAYNITSDEASPLAELIAQKQSQSEPLTYNDINRFLSKFIDKTNPLQEAISHVSC